MPAYNKIKIGKKEIQTLYWKQGLSTSAIAKFSGCSHATVLNRMKELHIPRRSKLGHTKPIKLSKEILEYFYYIQRLSLAKIARIIHRSEGGVERRFKFYSLKSRSTAQRAAKYKKWDFSGDPAEKAYLIGFRLGDLNVRPVVSVIQIRCSSTIPEQVNLIRKLFSPYTTVRATKGVRGDWDIVALVNNSFAFLTPKHEDIPNWILNNKDAFFSFFAGYTDAEGCFYLKRPGKLGKTEIASFEIQTQQRGIIFGLWKGLEKYSIRAPRPKISRTAGSIDKRNVRNNKDMWRIEVCRKKSLWKLIHFLEPHLKHGNKIKALKLVKENIVWRNSKPYCKPFDLTIPKLA
ncbi:MAG: hypothetical protein Q7S60_03440 [bacterium]|nr:hypothetical protein [bacterium]